VDARLERAHDHLGSSDFRSSGHIGLDGREPEGLKMTRIGRHGNQGLSDGRLRWAIGNLDGAAVGRGCPKVRFPWPANGGIMVQ